MISFFVAQKKGAVGSFVMQKIHIKQFDSQRKGKENIYLYILSAE
jgi:hypothetical protein